MRFKKIVLICIIIYLMTGISFSNDYFTIAEKDWMDKNKDKIFYLGLDPFSGMDYFEFNGEIYGYLLDVKDILIRETGLNIVVVGDKSWGEVYNGLQDGEIDILFGANKTRERLEIMNFTNPVYKYPYAVFSKKNSSVRTIGDLDNKVIGFIEGDIVINLFREKYDNIHYMMQTYNSQIDGLKALNSGEIDGFITSGGQIAYEFSALYSDIEEIATINTITSDMTLSTRKEDVILAEILNKVIDENYIEILDFIEKAKIIYNRKILKFDDNELRYLESNDIFVVGVPNDYLPFDYFVDGEYTGISGEVFKEIMKLTGLKYKVVSGSFSKLYYMMLRGEIDVLDMAKSEEREKYFIFPRPFNKERDIIVGKKTSPWVQDVYGLEGKKVAVVEGYWHKEYLSKNLKSPIIIITKSIEESLFKLEKGVVDYVIENPTVIDFYKESLGYNSIVKKGDTSKDSYFYFGVRKEKEELASIIDKSIALINYGKLKNIGLSRVPNLRNKNNVKLVSLVVLLVLFILILIYILYRIIYAYINQKTQTEILKNKEKSFYTDSLTDVKNRMYFNKIEEWIDRKEFPQAIIMLDLNNLKIINDKYGHYFGDELLVKFSEILTNIFVDNDIIRMGGDEFLVIIYGTNEYKCEFLLDKFMKECKNTKISDESSCICTPSASYGYVIRDSVEYSLTKARIDADKKMYDMKNKLKMNVFEEGVNNE